jgi:hypothetical protein
MKLIETSPPLLSSGVVNLEFPGCIVVNLCSACEIESAKMTIDLIVLLVPQASTSTAAPAKGTKTSGRAGTKRGKAAADEEIDADVEGKLSPKKRAKRGVAVGKRERRGGEREGEQ